MMVLMMIMMILMSQMDRSLGSGLTKVSCLFTLHVACLSPCLAQLSADMVVEWPGAPERLCSSVNQ